MSRHAKQVHLTDTEWFIDSKGVKMAVRIIPSEDDKHFTIMWHGLRTLKKGFIPISRVQEIVDKGCFKAMK